MECLRGRARILGQNAFTRFAWEGFRMSVAALPSPVAQKIPARKAVRYGWLFINVPVLGLIFAVPALALWLGAVLRLPEWVMLASLPVGIGLAWIWWSYATPKWRLWAMRRADNLYELHREAVRAQLVWPRGSIFENTEFKSTLHVLKEKHVEILEYFDGFRFFLDYLEAQGKSFYGLDELRRNVDEFRETQYDSDRSPFHIGAQKTAMDQLRLALKSARTVTLSDDWPLLMDELEQVLNAYQELSRRPATPTGWK